MDHNVTHATFTLERSYPVPPAQVFAAWAEPAAKASWFTPGPGFGHELDVRIGGREVATGGPDGGPVMTFETFYRDIVPDQRIVYTSTLSTETDLMTVSLTTVEFTPGADGGTRLVLTLAGDGFLRHMVRAITGSLVEVGRGRWTAGRLAAILASADRSQAGPTAPPQGLFLVSVRYC